MEKLKRILEIDSVGSPDIDVLQFCKKALQLVAQERRQMAIDYLNDWNNANQDTE